MDAGEAASRERIRDAIVAHVMAYHDPDEGDVVTDFVVVAGWVNVTSETDGVHITCSPATPGYTERGLLGVALSLFEEQPHADRGESQ